MWNLFTHWISTTLALWKKSYDRSGSDNVTSHTKGTPHYTDRILTTDDEHTDVLWIQGTICKTSSYRARNNNYPDIYYYMSKYGSSSTVYQAEQIAF